MLAKRFGSGQVWLLLPVIVLYLGLAALPLAIVIRMSFENGLTNYAKLLSSSVLPRVVENTLAVSALSTLFSVVLGYLLAGLLWQSSGRKRLVVLAFILLPFWTAVLIKNFAWTVLLQDNGPINQALLAIGVVDTPLRLLRNRFAVTVGMVHYLVPYAVFPIYSTMLTIDERLDRAARSLGASAGSVLWLVTVPLTRPGIYAAALLVFIISTSFYITPVVLGSPHEMMVANLVDFYAHEIVDFRTASALSVLVLAVATLLIAIYQALPKEGQHGAV